MSYATHNLKVQRCLHLALLAAFIMVAYYPVLDAPFIFDDYPNIVLNPAVHPANFAELGRVFDSEISANRPLALLTFALNYLAGGLDVFGYHLFNILIHLANALLLYGICLALPWNPPAAAQEPTSYQRQHLAFWATALWAMHPVQTQSVTYIVQRMTSLASFFYLLAILFFLLWRNRRVSMITAWSVISVSMLLGLLAKEIVITLPVALLLIDSLLYEKRVTRTHMLLLGMVLLGGLGAALFYLGGELPALFTTYPNRNFSPWERMMTQWRVFWHYLSLVVLPHPGRLHLSYDIEISRSILSPWTTLPSLAGILGSWTLAWRHRFRFGPMAMAWGFLFLTLALESSFLNLEIAFIHRLYLPGVFLFIGLLTMLPASAMRKMGMPLLLIIGLWSFWTVERNLEWNNGGRFWATDFDRGAGLTRSYNNQAASLIDSGNFEQALPLIEKGLTEKPNRASRLLLLYNKATSLYYLERLPESLAIFTTIADEFGGFRDTYLFIGLIYLKLDEPERVERLVTALMADQGSRYLGQILTANLLSRQGRSTEGEEIIENAINNFPAGQTERYLKLWLELARLYRLHGKNTEAYQCYLRVIDIFPHNYFAWLQIHAMLIAGGDTAGAAKIRAFLESKGVSIDRQ